LSIEQSSMSGGTRGRSFTGLFAPPKCAASGRVIQTGCQLWMIKIIGRLTRPCSGWPLPFTAHSPRGSAWCSTSRKAETMLGRSFSGKTARGPRRRGACGKGRRSTCPRFLACYSNTNKDCIERYERGEVKRRFSTQPRRVGTLRGDPRPAARCGERDFFRSNDDEYKQARLLSKSHHHYSPRAAKLNNARRAELPRGTASSAMVSPRPTSGGGSHSILQLRAKEPTMCLLFFFSTMMWRLGLAWVRGVYGAVERRLAAPAVVGRLGLVLDTELGFCRTRRRRTTKPGSPP
jgi:hypothetical protein